MRIQVWFPDWVDLLAVQGTLKGLLQTTVQRLPFFGHLSIPFFWHFYCPILTSIHDYWKIIALTRWTFVSKVMSLLFNMLSRIVIALLPRSKHLLISWLQSSSTVILETKKIKSLTVSIVSPSIWNEVIGPDVIIFIFWMLSFKPAFSLSSFTFIKRLFSSSSLSVVRVVLSAYLRWLIFLPAILIPACASSNRHLAGCTLHIS